MQKDFEAYWDELNDSIKVYKKILENIDDLLEEIWKKEAELEDKLKELEKSPLDLGEDP